MNVRQPVLEWLKSIKQQYFIACFWHDSFHSGEATGNLLQYSCLENPMDRGAW